MSLTISSRQQNFLCLEGGLYGRTLQTKKWFWTSYLETFFKFWSLFHVLCVSKWVLWIVSYLAFMIKASRVLSMIFFLFNLSDYVSFSTLKLFFFAGINSIDLLVRFSLVLSISFNSLDCISGFVLLCFFTSSNRFLFRLTLTSWNWLFQWLVSLKKMTSELTYGTLKFMNIYLLKVNSVHLSSAKHLCPNSWLLESWVFDFKY